MALNRTAKIGFALAAALMAATTAQAGTFRDYDPEDQMGPPGEHHFNCGVGSEKIFLYPDVNMALIRYGCVSETFHDLAGKVVYPQAGKICDYSAAKMADAFELSCRQTGTDEMSVEEVAKLQEYIDISRIDRNSPLLPDNAIRYGKINRYKVLSAERGVVLFDETAKTGKAGYLIDFKAGLVKSYFTARDGEAAGFTMTMDEALQQPRVRMIIEKAKADLQGALTLKP